MRSPLCPGILRRVGASALLALVAGWAVFGRIGPSLSEDMDGHRTQVDQIETALVFGELEAARASARWPAARPDHPNLPRSVLGPTEDMRVVARSLLRSGSTEDAARCASEIAAACGRCHGAAGVKPFPAAAAPPDPGPGLVAHMERRLWAVDRMWEALIASDDARWADGASALDGVSPLEGETPDSPAVPLALRLRELAIEAPGTVSERRAVVYGSVLSTCAGCHALTGTRPRAPRR